MIMKDPDEGKFMLNKPMLLKKIMFEGSRMARVPLLKLEDWDLVDTEWFPHLATNNFMQRVFYRDSDVTALELVKWICGIEKAGFLNLLWVPHYHYAPVIMIAIKQLLCLVHDG